MAESEVIAVPRDQFPDVEFAGDGEPSAARLKLLDVVPDGFSEKASGRFGQVPKPQTGSVLFLNPLLPLDYEVFLLELCALHLLAHPNRGHAAPGPLQALVLLALIPRLGLRTFARRDSLDRR